MSFKTKYRIIWLDDSRWIVSEFCEAIELLQFIRFLIEYEIPFKKETIL